jgi:HSP20 family protein
MALIKRSGTPNVWDPFQELRDIRDHMNRIFGGELMPTMASEGSLLTREWLPAAELSEESDSYLARLDLPGLDKDDIEISIDQDRLFVRGERKLEQEKKDKSVRFSERLYGRFERTIALPGKVDPEKVAASFKNGVLEIRLHKASSSASRKVAISG